MEQRDIDELVTRAIELTLLPDPDDTQCNRVAGRMLQLLAPAERAKAVDSRMFGNGVSSVIEVLQYAQDCGALDVSRFR